MKLTSLLLVVAGATILTGCSELVALNPFATEKEAMVDDNLAGAWKNSDGDLFLIHRNDSEYSIAFTDAKNKEVAKFRGYLIKTGNLEVLDLISKGEDAFQVPVHAIVRIWQEGSVMRWTFLDSQWLRDQAAQQLATQPSDKRTLVTATTEAFRAFVLKYAGDDRAYQGDPMILSRVM